jgi:aconitate hydratase
MIAIGVGGADAVDAMAGEGCMFTLPKLIGVHLRGKLHGWTAPKDIILKLAGILTVKGGTGSIIEYFGEGTSSLSCTGKATITNMGAELGATTSIFPYDERLYTYLCATGREDIAALAEQYKEWLQPDPEILQQPDAYYDTIIEIDLSSLEPHVVGPHTPDLARPISQLARDVRENNWPMELSTALIGSCTNSSYEDLTRAAHIVRQAVAQSLKVKCPLLVTPGSEQIYQTIQRDGILEIFQQAGAILLANACGPCIGQWNRPDFKDKPNSILTSYNRNFKQRNDGHATTHAFIASPELVTALAFAGTLAFNPLTDSLARDNGTQFLFDAPHGEEVPAQGFVSVLTGYEAPTGVGDVHIDEKSDRLQLLTLFPKLDCRRDFICLKVLVKAAGKCTTDHISPAGPWLRYRGHLDKISDNLFCGVTNAFQQEIGKGKNQISLAIDPLAKIARDYKQHNVGWIAVGDENYGEGSSREHAAMEPRYLGCRAILAKSFARIAETNLKKQGILPLWFTHPEDYNKIQEDDVVTFPDLLVAEFAPVTLVMKHSDGSLDTIQTTHTLNQEQVQWFYTGSALNYFREKEEQRSVEEQAR